MDRQISSLRKRYYLRKIYNYITGHSSSTTPLFCVHVRLVRYVEFSIEQFYER